MAYRVEISRAAEAELEALYLWVTSRAPSQGAAWFNGLERAVLALDEQPERCPVAPESMQADRPIRVLRYGRKPHIYLVFFTADSLRHVVQVIHVRRGARRRPTAQDLQTEP
jgi:plasmid stabilization system protein ParE